MYDLALHVVVMKLFESIERIPAMLINHIILFLQKYTFNAIILQNNRFTKCT